MTSMLTELPRYTPPRQGRRARRAGRRGERQEARRRARDAAQSWPRSHRTVACLLAVVAAGIAGVAFWSLFESVIKVMSPHMRHSWTVPVAGELTLAYFFGDSILHALRRSPSGAIRPVFTTLLMAGSVAIQAYAARGGTVVSPVTGKATAAGFSAVSLVGHEVVVVGFLGVVLSAKATVLSLLGGKVRADRITVTEWLAHPVQCGRLWRWRATWGEPSSDRARDRYQRLLYMEAVVQADPRVGAGRDWKSRLPVTLRYQLTAGVLPGAAGDSDSDTWMGDIREHVAAELMLLPADTQDDSPGDSSGTTDGDTEDDSARREDDSRGDNRDDTEDDSRGDKPRDTGSKTSWPIARDMPPAKLARLVTRAVDEWERGNPGRPMPASHLGDAVRVRMTRDPMAKRLLAAEYDRRAGRG